MKKFDPQQWVESRKAAMLKIKKESSSVKTGLPAEPTPTEPVLDHTLSQSWDQAISRNDNLDHISTSVYVENEPSDDSPSKQDPRLLTYEISDIGDAPRIQTAVTGGTFIGPKVDASLDRSVATSRSITAMQIPLSEKAPVLKKPSSLLVPSSATASASSSPNRAMVISPTRPSTSPRIGGRSVRKVLSISDRTNRMISDAKACQNPGLKSSFGEIVTRQMLDKNTLRLTSRDVFMSAVKLWREGFGPRGPVRAAGALVDPAEVLVYVRKRPIFPKEVTDKQEYDTVTANETENTLVVHNCLFHADLRRPLIAHNHFNCFNKVFGEDSQNSQLYKDSAAQEMVRFACSGGLSSIFMFGQTGSGKTYTMTALEALAAEDIFGFGGNNCTVTISFIEVAGKKAFDLLSDISNGDNPEVKMRELPDGSMQAVGANEIEVNDGETLRSSMELGHGRRATRATGANSESSRSHAICSIRIKVAETIGKLMLVDCAGSERRKDSACHDKERRREGAEINSSLHALKECMRWRAEKSSGRKVTSAVPFRGSLLTRVLSEAFTKPVTMLAVIATISPCATDVEHTLSTLRTVHFLSNKSDSTAVVMKQTQLFPKEEKAVKLHPGKWTSEMASTWVTRISGGRAEIVKGTTGKMLVRMTESRLCQIAGGDEQLARDIYKALHRLIKDPQCIETVISGLSAKTDVVRRRPSNGSVPSTASSGKSSTF